MNSIFILFLYFLSFPSMYGQVNLILNPSFEDLLDCPNQPSQIENSLFWKAENITPDLFTYCSTNPRLRPPFVFNYFVEPVDGDVMAGLFTFSNLNETSEEISTELLDSMKSNKLYYFSFMHRVPVGFDPTFYCESRNLNICFVKELESIECENPLFSYESLLNYNLDTTAWVKRTSLIRGQGQKYMKIGNYFNYQQSTELSNCVSRVLANGSGYNFVDDFKLFELSLLPDTIFICDNSQYIYQLQYVDNESYYLNNQEINDFIILDSEGVYTIERKFSDLSYYDTLTLISIYDYVEVLRDDILICEGEDFRLSDYINVELFDSININGYLDVSEILYEGNYEFEFFMECGSDIFTLNLLNSTCNCTEYIPNSFSPNYDGVNDVFMPNIFCEDSDLLYMNIKIFDRWGGLVYSQNGDNIIGWNGLGMNNETMENGAYAYVLEYQYTVYSGIIRDKIVYGDLVLLK